MCSNQAFHTHQPPRGDAAATARLQRKVKGALSPTFRLFGGTIETIPAALKALAANRTQVEQAARSVGRIHQGLVTLGTGFVIGPNVIMTARHVAQSFGTDVDGVLKIRIGWTPAIDFLAEEPPPVAASASYPITSILYDNEEFDIALLLVPFISSALPTAERAAMKEPSFEPLTLAMSAVTADRRDVCVIGCPDQDPFATDTERNLIFKGVFDVKRVQPGAINRVLMDGALLGHTCSTLRGNSGSPVIDLATNQVIGLHLRGSREQPGEPALNEATALWLLPAAVSEVLMRARDIYASVEPVATSATVETAVAASAATPTKPAAIGRGAGAIASA